MWQTGGVRGNLIGNVTGNASTATVATTARTCTGNSATSSSCTGNAATATTASSCSGNSATATRLQTARNISLSGDVTGSASFNGSANVIITTNLANVTVATGTVRVSSSSDFGNGNIAYPSGFNKDNCIPISVAIYNSTDPRWDFFNSLYNNLTVSLYSNTISVAVNAREGYIASGTYNVKVMLMKI